MSTPTKRPDVFAWHVTTGTITPDEARRMVFELGPLPDGAGEKPVVTNSAIEAAPGMNP